MLDPWERLNQFKPGASDGITQGPQRPVIRERSFMKRSTRFLVSSAVVVGVGALAIVSAFSFGQKSPLFGSGDIVLKEDLTDSAKGISTLFLIVYDQDSPMPMPYGAARFSLKDPAKGSFKKFILTNEVLRVMQGERPMPKTMRLKARLDVDGSAGMDQPGDLVGELTDVPFGKTGLTLTIDRKVQ